jgi:ribosomal protein S27AE
MTDSFHRGNGTFQPRSGTFPNVPNVPKSSRIQFTFGSYARHRCTAQQTCRDVSTASSTFHRRTKTSRIVQMLGCVDARTCPAPTLHVMGRRQREKAERKQASRPAGTQPDSNAPEPRPRCPQCGSTNLAEGEQAFEGRFLMCGNCGWQGETKPGVWG